MKSSKQDVAKQEIPTRVNEIRRFIRVLLSRPVVIVGLIILLVFLFCISFPGLLASYDPNEQNLREILTQPNSDHLLGTDSLGRDVFSRVIFGTRTAFIVGVFPVLISATISIILGLLAGYFGGITNTIIMRFVDAMMAFPPLILTLAIAGLLGGGLIVVIIALGIGHMPAFARVMCGQAMSVREQDYILALQSIGAGHTRIMFRHVLINTISPLIVLMTMTIGINILAEAGLSFLGVGIKEPAIAWGSLVNNGYKYLLTYPLLSTAPGVAIILVVFAFNMVGDGVRDAIDPKLRGTL